MFNDINPIEMRDLAAERWGAYDQLERATTVDPNTGMAMGQPPAQARGVPVDLLPPPTPDMGATEDAGPGGAPGATGLEAGGLTGPLPSEASQQSLLPLGELGAVEQQALTREAF